MNKLWRSVLYDELYDLIYKYNKILKEDPALKNDTIVLTQDISGDFFEYTRKNEKLEINVDVFKNTSSTIINSVGKTLSSNYPDRAKQIFFDFTKDFFLLRSSVKKRYKANKDNEDYSKKDELLIGKMFSANPIFLWTEFYQFPDIEDKLLFSFFDLSKSSEEECLKGIDVFMSDLNSLFVWENYVQEYCSQENKEKDSMVLPFIKRFVNHFTESLNDFYKKEINKNELKNFFLYFLLTKSLSPNEVINKGIDLLINYMSEDFTPARYGWKDNALTYTVSINELIKLRKSVNWFAGLRFSNKLLNDNSDVFFENTAITSEHFNIAEGVRDRSFASKESSEIIMYFKLREDVSVSKEDTEILFQKHIQLLEKTGVILLEDIEKNYPSLRYFETTFDMLTPKLKTELISSFKDIEKEIRANKLNYELSLTYSNKDVKKIRKI